MEKRKGKPKGGEQAPVNLGFFGGLGSLLGKLAELAEKGQELREGGDIRAGTPVGEVRGVYGFTVKVCQGGKGGVTVEPFGNVHQNEQTGEAEVDAVREPLVDIFDEPNHVLVVVEMPGITEEDIQLELTDDILTITAARADKKYHKEVLLPTTFAKERMSKVCRNGVLEVRFARA